MVIADMQDGVLLLDRQGGIVEHNPQAMRLLGMDALRGQALAAVLPGLEARWRRWRRRADARRLPSTSRCAAGKCACGCSTPAPRTSSPWCSSRT
jgi:PAS domain-containing protein